MKVMDYIESKGVEFEKSTKEEIGSEVIATLIASEQFINLISEFDPDWGPTLHKATYDPNAALNDLKASLTGFFSSNGYTMETFIDQILWGVLMSPEFLYCASESGPEWLSTIEWSWGDNDA